MREIKSLLMAASFSDESIAKIAAAIAPAEMIRCSLKDKDTVAKALESAEVAILQSDLNDQILTGQHLKWIHCCHAGLTHSARPEVFERNILLTSAAGRAAPMLAEHALFFMLSLTYEVKKLLCNQENHVWKPLPEFQTRSGLYGKTAGIIGVGKTGSELAIRLKALGMRVLGYRRADANVPGVDVMYCSDKGDGIDTIIKESDYIILCINLSDATYRMIGAEQFRQMKNSAYVINMSRGGIIDEDALISALENGEIAGAGLDTVTDEPLSPGSPLWDMQNVMITPHSSPQMIDREERTVATILANIEAYKNGAPMQNEFTARDVYTK